MSEEKNVWLSMTLNWQVDEEGRLIKKWQTWGILLTQLVKMQHVV